MKYIILFLFLSSTLLARGAEKKEHTVERGETIESIAKLYSTTPEAIYELNPTAKTMFFTGMILIIPESTSTSNAGGTSTNNSTAVGSNLQTHSQATNNNTSQIPAQASYTPSSQSESGLNPEEFSNVFVTYNASFKSFDHGFYGIGFTSFSKFGWGWTLSAYGSWGLIDPGQLAFRFGPLYGHVVNPYIMLAAQLRGYIFTYDKANEKGSTDQKVNGGITLTPTIYLKAGKIVIGVGYELGWVNNNKKMFHGAHFSIGL